MSASGGIEAEDIRIGEIPGYEARPTGAGPFPIVLVVQEIFGINDYIRDVCRRLAKLGYYAVAPEMFFRQGDPSQYADYRDIQTHIVPRVPDEHALADLDAAADYAMQSGKGDAGRLAITGFCWGGRITWLYAAHNSSLKAAAAWYGRLTGATDSLHPKHPLDVAAGLHCPVLGLYGGQDASIPLDTVERMQEALRHVGGESEILVYPDAGHAFHADYRPSYHQPSAEDGWGRMQEWFEQHGVK